MTREYSQLRLDAAMGDPRAQAELKRIRERDDAEQTRRIRHQIQLDLIRMGGRLAVERIRREGEERIARVWRDHDETHRSEERLLRDLAAGAWKTKNDARLVRKYVRHRIDTALADVPPDRTIAGYRRHIEALLLQHGITAVFGAVPATNAYAWASAKRVDFAPIVSPESYSIALHEIGHVVNPCQPAHVRAPMTTGTCCPRCELTAWLWAIDVAVEWTRRMHDEMADAIGTYREYASAVEAAEIDDLAGTKGFCDARLRRAMK